MASKLYYFYGAMGSAKTLRLLSTAYNFEEKNIGFVCLKPSIDTRDGENKIHSRAGLERECKTFDKSSNLFNIIENLILDEGQSIKKVIVDECQFLTPLQVHELSSIVDKLDIDVMCYGLRTDFQGLLFDGAKTLFELADTIEEVKSHCSCGRKAIMNARFTQDGQLVVMGDTVQIGGNESYKPLCRKCYFELRNKTIKVILKNLDTNINETSN